MKQILTLLLIQFLMLTNSIAQQNTFTNPILRGGYPDPSICKVGDTFYIVNSSFEYFPGLPIHKSTDLINWELIGYGLHRAEQCSNEVNLLDVQSDGGIHAPTIRFNNGLFYIITTNVYYHEKKKKTDFVNFIITAENPKGPWSEPYVLEGAPGIDPDIFFDDDGKVWYTGTHAPEDPNFQGEGEIWLHEINIKKMELTGERSFLWRGACGGVWAEGPHLYKKDGRYYLMIAEGGTSFNHAVMIAVSDSIRGPYISNERNPILTSRHLSYDNWVHSTGHADIIQINDSLWYMTCLGIRGDKKRASNMGRETHLVPLIWEREPFDWKKKKYEWPVVSPKTGKLERRNNVPFKNTKQYRKNSFFDNFDSETLDLQWNFRRVPHKEDFFLVKGKDKNVLRIKAHSNRLENRKRASFIGFRQTESDFNYEIKMYFDPKKDNTEAGAAIVQKDDNYISFTIIKKSAGFYLQVKQQIQNEALKLVKELKLENFPESIRLKIESKNNSYSYYYTDNSGVYKKLTETSSDLVLSKKYTGAYLGLYITSNGQNSDEYADFDYVRYTAYERF